MGWLRLVGGTLLLLYATLVLGASALFLSGRSLSHWNTLAALCVAFGFFFWQGRKRLRLKLPVLVTSAAGLAAFLITILLLCGALYDLSWDGRDYQQRAVLQLSQGWNPAKQVLEPKNVYYIAWLNHYPRGPWIAAASIYQITGAIETAKAFNLLLMGAVFCLGLAYFLSLQRLKTWEALLLSGLLAANPVSVYQSMSFYVDGQASSAIVLLILALLLAAREDDLIAYVTVAASLVIGLNIKFTAAAYSIFFLGMALLWLAVFKINPFPKAAAPQNGRARNARQWRRLGAVAILGCVLGIGVAGSSPYWTNYTRYGHPFYPTYGDSQFNKAFVLNSQFPVELTGRSWLEKLAISIFSYSQDSPEKYGRTFKLPFLVTWREIKAFKLTDVRLGGWGPLFGMAVLLSLPGMYLLYRKDRQRFWPGLGLVGIILVSTLLNSEAWWARYTPQLWLAPFCVLACLLISRVGRSLVILGYLLLAVMVLNVGLVSGAYAAGNALDTWQVNRVLDKLSAQDQEVLVYEGPLSATETMLAAHQIRYRVVETRQELPCPESLAPGVFYSLQDCQPDPSPSVCAPSLDEILQARIHPAGSQDAINLASCKKSTLDKRPGE